MISDLIAFLSGRIPGGIVLLPVMLVAFGIIWFIIWQGTRFWTRKRLWQVFITGWILIIALYSAAWNANRPPPIPTRVLIHPFLAGGHPISLGQELVSRLRASPKPIVVLTPDYIPALTSVRNEAELFEMAAKMKVKWMLEPAHDDENRSSDVKVNLWRFKKGSYETEHEINISYNRQSNHSEFLRFNADSIASIIESSEPLDTWPGMTPDVPNTAIDSCQMAENWVSEVQQGQSENALKTLASLRDAYPDWSKPYLSFARVSMDFKEEQSWVDVNAALVKAAELEPANTEIYILMAQHFLDLRDWDEAESALKLALNLDSFDPRIYGNLAKLSAERYHDLDLKDKEELLNYALYLAPGYDEASLELARYNRGLLRKPWALMVLHDALDINPRSTSLLLSLSATYLGMGKNEEAAEACRRILEINPRHPEGLYNLGMGLLWMGQYEESIALFDSSFAIGGNSDNYYYIAIAHIRLQEWDEAISAFQKRLAFMKSRDDKVAISCREMVKLVRQWKTEERDNAPGIDSLLTAPR